MNLLLRLCMLLALVLPALTPLHAQTQPQSGQGNIQARLLAETQSPAPGDSVTMAIIMRPNAGWHDYWLNPGDAGTPLELEWDLPAGVSAGPIRAPVPGLLWAFGYANYVYEAEHAFLVDLKIDPGIARGTELAIGVEARWSECSDRLCVAGGAKLAASLTVGEGRIAPAMRQQFDGYRSAIPLQLDRKGSFELAGDKLRLAIPYPAGGRLDAPYFFPLETKIVDHSGAQRAARLGEQLILTLPLCRQPFCVKPQDGFSGLLRIGDRAGVMVDFSPGKIPEGGEEIAVLQGNGQPPENIVQGGGQSFIPIFFAALLGGLLLNLMPCVFPILGLKALSLAKMGGEEKTARRDALAYSAGITVMCLALGGIMLALRAGGEQVGWAFQLQEPRVVLALFLLMLVITANLAGLFEMGVALPDRMAEQDSRFGSFGTGVLAAIIATPCTGPFMAAALGAALLLPAIQALGLFAALGLGLALPYLAIAHIPALRRRLPKPGPWLESFRRWMAVPMGLTALALGWLLWRLSGQWGLLAAALGVAAMLAALWRVRLDQRAGKGAWGGALAVVIAAAALVWFLPADPVKHGDAVENGQLLGAENFSEARLAELRREGRGVFVYFTADWCVTCKVNEAAAINREATADHFARQNIAVLVGDFTRRDPALARMLADYGSAGVPLYLWFAPGKEAVKLPQILTAERLESLK